MFARIVPVTQLCARGWASKSSFVSANVKLILNSSRNSQLTGKLCQSQLSTSAPRSARASRGKVNVGEVKEPSAGIAAINVGRASLAGASLLGIGGLCYYGLGLSSQSGAVDRVALWPEYVRKRIRDTYMYFGGSILATAGSAVAIFKNPTLFRIVASNGMMALFVSIAALIGTSMLCRSIEYKPGFGAKQITWLMHTAVVGAVIAPLAILGGPLLVRAAWYTAGIVGGLSTIAMCAPSDKFLNMGGPLAAGLGVVFVSNIASFFFPPTSNIGLGLYSVVMYGGLILFSAFLLYDTQRIVHHAESVPHPAYGLKPYDPINASMSIYMDTINIFIRIAMMLAGNNRKK